MWRQMKRAISFVNMCLLSEKLRFSWYNYKTDLGSSQKPRLIVSCDRSSSRVHNVNVRFVSVFYPQSWNSHYFWEDFKVLVSSTEPSNINHHFQKFWVLMQPWKFKILVWAFILIKIFSQLRQTVRQTWRDWDWEEAEKNINIDLTLQRNWEVMHI